MTPTAKDFIKIYLKNNPEGTYDLCMIEFAKMHVKEALKEASEKVEVNMWVGLNKDEEQFEELKNLDSLHLESDAQSILNAYSLTNIK